ncbi:MAG: hypothetical protein DRQ02_00985 [Candidatus Latescibacterota bacterium]|nr:MAG: hypothetical protein DRQ02_00985 [Candidatus Latescibacterota bacterium]
MTGEPQAGRFLPTYFVAITFTLPLLPVEGFSCLSKFSLDFCCVTLYYLDRFCLLIKNDVPIRKKKKSQTAKALAEVDK